MYAITVRPDNTGAEVELADTGSQATLDSLYREIGCRTLEALRLAADLYAWFDEEAGSCWSTGPRAASTASTATVSRSSGPLSTPVVPTLRATSRRWPTSAARRSGRIWRPWV